MNSNFIKIFTYIVIFFVFLSNFDANSSNQRKLYSKKSISSYFSGLISSSSYDDQMALKYFNNLNHLKNNHDKYNHEIIFSLIQTQKIPEALSYLRKLKKQNLNFFNANLLLGINYFLELQK